MRYEIVPVGYLETNCVILWDETTLEGVVIDPGDNPQKIMAVVQQKSVNVTHILLTHTHYDHIGAVKTLRDSVEPHPMVMCSEVEHKIMMASTSHPEVDKSFGIDRYVVHDDEILVGGIRIRPILLPGHTDASICYYVERDKLLIAGDTLFYRDIGIQRHYSGPQGDLPKNIKKQLFALPDETVVIPGHDRTTTVGEEKKFNPYVR